MLRPRTAFLLLVLPVLVACAAEPAPAARAPRPELSSSVAVPSPAAELVPVGEGQTLVATAVVDLVEVFDSPDATAPTQALDRRAETSGELVFVVEEQTPDRLRVQLPVRPNGSTGWVRVADVALAVHDYAIQVRLSAHELVVTNAGAEVLRAPIGVGKGATPTPGGTYYVKELLQPPSPGGPYGSYAYGLSGFSNELTSFAGGNGVIGIHGTDRPDLVGTDVSSGCVRLTNDVIERLVEEVQLPLGTPVDVQA